MGGPYQEDTPLGGRGLIRGVNFGGRGLIRGHSFGGRGLIRGVDFGGRGLIRGVNFGGRGLIRGVDSYKALPSKDTPLIRPSHQRTLLL